MGKKNKDIYPTEEQLIERGYLTIDEFIYKFSESLRGYMYSNWPSAEDELHHPEDLAATAAIYTEVMYRVMGDFS